MADTVHLEVGNFQGLLKIRLGTRMLSDLPSFNDRQFMSCIPSSEVEKHNPSHSEGLHHLMTRGV